MANNLPLREDTHLPREGWTKRVQMTKEIILNDVEAIKLVSYAQT